MTDRTLPSALVGRIERAASPCPEHPWVSRLVAVVTERTTTGLTLRPSFALYVGLLLLAHLETGRVLVMKDALAKLFLVRTTEIDGWLSDLERARLVRVLSRGLYLALVVEKWLTERQDSIAPSIENPSKTEGEKPPSIPPPGSALLCSANENSFGSDRRILQGRAEAKAKAGVGVEGLGGGEEGFRELFLDRLVEALGAPDERPSLETFCRSYPRAILEAALDRVEKTPLSKIRKSRGALFVHLVKTYSQSNPQR